MAGLILKNEETIAQMEETVSDCSYERLKDLTPIRKMLTLGAGINQLRQLFTGEILEQFVQLANTPLGFLTDEKNYSKEQIRDCVIEAWIRGVNPTGNEFNIIAGRCYITKQFYRRVIGDFAGLTDLRDTYGTPREQGASALVPCKARWKLNGKEDVIDCSTEGTLIVVRNNKGMTSDALLGKAESKLLKRVWMRLTGSKQSDIDSYYGAEDGVVEGKVTEEQIEINWDQVEMDILVDACESDCDRGDGLPTQVRSVGEYWWRKVPQEDRDRVTAIVNSAIERVKSHRGERSNSPA